ncbi:protein of unknown function DUF3310 [Vibrio phage 1.262.O._10N.286.51.A9]|nr:protein of unknown function DUF3310 [Vibrio phage 1.262.O._10N.286.51.A9]
MIYLASVYSIGTNRNSYKEIDFSAIEDTIKPKEEDVVNSPKHYMVVGNTEAKDLIKVMLEQYVEDNPNATPYQIYCAGNIFKYRLRVGAKDAVEQEIGKVKKYGEMHDDN